MPTKQITRESLAKLATVELTIEPETMPYEGNASAIGPDEDAETNAWIRSELDRGNTWAWCSALVTVEYDGLTGLASLGGCSYESRKAFEESNLADMTSEALDDLWAQLEARTPAGRARKMASSARQAIVTCYRSAGPTIIARCEAKRITVQWDDSLDVAGNHAAAALQLMDQLGWSERNDLVMGGTRDGYVFVQVPKAK